MLGAHISSLFLIICHSFAVLSQGPCTTHRTQLNSFCVDLRANQPQKKSSRASASMALPLNGKFKQRIGMVTHNTASKTCQPSRHHTKAALLIGHTAGSRAESQLWPLSLSNSRLESAHSLIQPSSSFHHMHSENTLTDTGGQTTRHKPPQLGRKMEGDPFSFKV